MFAVIVGYYLLKNTLSIRREDPLQRGTFETIYYQFAQDHPHLWSRSGPKHYVRPHGLFSKIKWVLVKHWFSPSRTISRKPLADVDDMSLTARIKHSMARRWLGEIRVHPGSDSLTMLELGVTDDESISAGVELASIATPVAMAQGAPRAALLLANNTLRRQRSGSRRSRANSDGSRMGGVCGRLRSSISRSGRENPSPAASERMVEEEEDAREGIEVEDVWTRAEVDEEEREERSETRV
jgi:hypothetical protein